MSAAASLQDATAASSTAAPTAASASVTQTEKGTTLVSGKTINDDGEEEEFTIETIPLAQLSTDDTDKLANLASKVLKYFDEEAAERNAATKPTDSSNPQ